MKLICCFEKNARKYWRMELWNFVHNFLHSFFTIHGMKNSHYIPILFCLLSNKKNQLFWPQSPYCVLWKFNAQSSWYSMVTHSNRGMQFSFGPELVSQVAKFRANYWLETQFKWDWTIFKPCIWFTFFTTWRSKRLLRFRL